MDTNRVPLKYVFRFKSPQPEKEIDFSQWDFPEEKTVVFWGCKDESLTIIYPDHAEKIVYED